MHEQALSSPRSPRPADTHDPVTDNGRLVEVEAQLIGADLGSVRGLAHLRLRCREANGQVLQQQLGPHLAEATAQLVRGLVRPDRGHGTRVDGTGVEALFQFHQAHAGFGVPGQDRPFHGRGTPPARQERKVDVDHWDDSQYIWLDQPPIGDNNPELGAGRNHVGWGVRDRQAQLLRRLLHRARARLETATPPGIRAGYHEADVVACAGQRPKRLGRHLGGAEEGEPHNADGAR